MASEVFCPAATRTPNIAMWVGHSFKARLTRIRNHPNSHDRGDIENVVARSRASAAPAEPRDLLKIGFEGTSHQARTKHWGLHRRRRQKDQT